MGNGQGKPVDLNGEGTLRNSAATFDSIRFHHLPLRFRHWFILILVILQGILPYFSRMSLGVILSPTCVLHPLLLCYMVGQYILLSQFRINCRKHVQ